MLRQPWFQLYTIDAVGFLTREHFESVMFFSARIYQADAVVVGSFLYITRRSEADSAGHNFDGRRVRIDESIAALTPYHVREKARICSRREAFFEPQEKATPPGLNRV